MSTRAREIQSAVAPLLDDCPLVKKVEPFGSLATATDDAYSDIDLRLHVDDLVAAVAARHEVLGKLGDAEIEWIVHRRPGSFCSSLLFSGESCYHWLDLDITSAADIPQSELVQAALEAEWPAGLYLPAPDTPGHFLIGQFLGGIRYAKARKRGQNLTCWRFASAMVDWLCALLYEEAHNWQNLGRKLNTEEYQWLDAHLEPDRSQDVRAALDFSSPEAADAGAIKLLGRIVELATKKGEALGQPIPGKPISRLSEPLKAELTSV